MHAIAVKSVMSRFDSECCTALSPRSSILRRRKMPLPATIMRLLSSRSPWLNFTCSGAASSENQATKGLGFSFVLLYGEVAKPQSHCTLQCVFGIVVEGAMDISFSALCQH